VRITGELTLSAEPVVEVTQTEQRNQVKNNSTIRDQTLPDDRGLTLLAVGLSVAIIALLIKKFLKSYWWIGA